MAKILLVEDERVIRAEVKRILGRDGHDVTDVASVAVAEKERPECFDLVITDVRLTGETGDVLIERAGQGSPDGWLAQVVRSCGAGEGKLRPGDEAVLERMSEMMVLDLVRRHLERLPETQGGWLGGLRDRFVGRALALMHAHPERAWTIDRLADETGLSRSALHERFVQFTGQAPMQYLAGWRMQRASGLLRQSDADVTSIALEVGYESVAAFSRAFKRATGLAPTAWRKDAAANRPGPG